MKVLKTCGAIILAIMPLLLIVGFARVMVQKDTFLPSAQELYTQIMNMPDFYTAIRSDIGSIGNAFSGLSWDFGDVVINSDVVSSYWNDVSGLISFFTALGMSIAMAFNYMGQFFVNIGKFFTAFVPVFQLLYHIVITPINFINWVLSVLFGYDYVYIG